MSLIESETELLPHVIADSVCMEAAQLCSDEKPLSYAQSMIDRAEAVYAANPHWAKSIRKTNGRDTLYAFMRHWLAGSLKKDHPKLFLKLPTRFSLGVASHAPRA